MLADEINNFTQQVKDSFETRPYPGDDNIVSIITFNSNPDDSLKVLQIFKGRKWQDITLEGLVKNRDNLSIFTKEAYCYYLPSYMIASIYHFAEVDVLKSNVLFSLTPPDYSTSIEAWFNNTAKEFTLSQILTIRKFLELYGQLSPEMLMYDPNHHIQRAQEFWGKLEA